MINFKEFIKVVSLELKLNYMFKSKVVIVLFRLCNYLGRNKITIILFSPLIIFYILIVEWLLGIEIPFKTKIGKGLIIYHGYGLVINGYTVIGENCILRQGVTIGNKTRLDGSNSGAPIIKDNVEFGANSAVIGEITICSFSRIGAGTVVTKDVAEKTTVVSQSIRCFKNHQ